MGFLCLFVCFISISPKQHYSNNLEYVAFSCSLVNLPITTLLKKRLTLSFLETICWQLFVSYTGGTWANLSSPCWDFCLPSTCTILVDAVKTTVSSYVPVPFWVQTILFPHSYLPSRTLTPFPCALSKLTLKIWEAECGVDIPWIAENSTLSCSLPHKQLRVSVLITIYCT